jgi:hypothetical protein
MKFSFQTRLNLLIKLLVVHNLIVENMLFISCNVCNVVMSGLNIIFDDRIKINKLIKT